MLEFKITAWPEDEKEREYNPAWETTVSAATQGIALAEGTKLFHEECPTFDHDKYFIHASTA